MSAGAGIDAVRLAFWFGVPGLGLALIAPARTFDPLERAALIVPLGYSALAVTGMALVSVGLLTRTSSAVAWIMLTWAAWMIALVRGRVTDGAKRALQAVRGSPAAFLLGMLLLIAYGAVRWTYGPGSGLFPTALRYWVDGLEIADAGRVPERSLHWGIEVPPTVSKVLLNVVYARSSYWLGREPLGALAANLFLVAVSLFLGLVALFRRLALRRLALPLALVMTASPFVRMHTFSGDLRVMVAENWGRVIAVGALLALAVALTTRDPPERRRLAILCGLLLGVTATTHLVAALAAAVAVVGLCLGRFVLERQARATAGLIVIAGAVSLALTGIVLGSAGGDLGFQGAGGDRAYREVREAVGLPPGVDPVAFLTTEGDVARSASASYAPVDVFLAIPNKLLGRDPLHGGPGGLGAWLVLVIAGAAALGVTWRSRVSALLALAIGAALVIAICLIIGVAFAARYDTFALANFGSRRLMQYFTFGGLLLVAAGLEAAMTWLANRIAVAVVVIVTILMAIAFLPRMTGEAPATAAGDVAALAWIRDNVPCEGRVLVTRRTLATVQAFSGRAGVIEGMGPHVRPSLLTRALSEMIAAKAFLADPEDASSYVRERGVAAIVVAGGPAPRFAGWKHLHADLGGLERAPFLRPSYRSADIEIFVVDRWKPVRGAPLVRGRPGFAC